MQRGQHQDALAQSPEEIPAVPALVQKDDHTARDGAAETVLPNVARSSNRSMRGTGTGRSLSTQLAAQVSVSEQLRTSLSEARAERERLLQALAAEREHAVLEFKQAEKGSQR